MFQGWSFIPQDMQEMEGASASNKAINKIQVVVSGPSVYQYLKFESKFFSLNLR